MRELKSANNTTRTKSKLFNLFQSPISEDDSSPGTSTNSDAPSSPVYNSTPSISPPSMSPWNAAASAFVNSPWTHTSNPHQPPSTGLLASLTREHGHLYSLAAKGNLLYTGSDSKNIRVWKNHDEFSGFKSRSGLVKAIILSGEKIFTGHRDGKIRVWKVSTKDPTVHKRIGTLPRLKDFLRSSINPSNYVEVRRHGNTVWLRHFDAVSCLSLDEEEGLLYSGSWDKTFKVWRISDSRCLESVNAHDDAINSVAVGFSGMVFTGSADGTVKVWRREKVNGKSKFYFKHVLVKVLLKQESAVTAVAVSHVGGVVYCGSSDGTVNYWENGRKLVHGGVLRGHKLAVLCVATAGNLVISGSADRTIRVWRREGGDHVQVAVLKGHVGPIKCLAVVEEEEEMGGGTCGGPRWVVYSGSLDKSVKIWRVAEKGGEGQHVMMTPPPHVMEEGKWGFGSDLRWVRNWAA